MLSYIVSSPFIIFFYVTFLVSFIVDAFLYYAVWKYTPRKMEDIKPILQSLVLFQMLYAFSNNFGTAPEYMYPIDVYRINGLCKFFGQQYGPTFAIANNGVLIFLCGSCIIECVFYRYIIIFQHVKLQNFLKKRINFISYLVSHSILGFAVLVPGMAIIHGAALISPQDYLVYAKSHNIPTYSPKFDYSSDVLVILNPTIVEYQPYLYLLVGAVVAGVIVNYFLSILMYRRFRQLASTLSSRQYRNQIKLTIMLLGQGLLPVFFVMAMSIAVLLTLSAGGGVTMCCFATSSHVELPVRLPERAFYYLYFSMGITLSYLKGWIWSPQNFRTVMIGLDNAGKTTLLYKFKPAKAAVTIIPTTGFNVETVSYRNISFTVWDIGGQGKLPALWHCYFAGSQRSFAGRTVVNRHYYCNTQAVIFVVDSSDSDRMDQARKEFQALLTNEQLQDCKFLIFANKIDLPLSKSAAIVAEEIGLMQLKTREWCVQSCCARTGHGILEGLEQLYLSVTGKKPMQGEIN